MTKCLIMHKIKYLIKYPIKYLIVLSFAHSAAAGWQCDRLGNTFRSNSVRQSVFFPSSGHGVAFHEGGFRAEATAGRSRIRLELHFVVGVFL